MDNRKLSNFIFLLKFCTKTYKKITWLAILLAISFSCSTYQGISKKDYKSLNIAIDTSTVFSSIFTGFALFDPALGNFLIQREADKYYTPASNTKLYTLYASLQILGDSLPALAYVEEGDSIIFWGTGYPLLLHPDFDLEPKLFNWLKGQKKSLLYTNQFYEDDHFGPGWSWADYPYAYQVEKSSLPLYGNFIQFKKELDGPIQIIPELARHWIKHTENSSGLRRVEHQNLFYLNKERLDGRSIDRAIPFKTNDTTVIQLLSDTLQKDISLYTQTVDTNLQVKTLNVSLPDTLLRQFMRQSDNFLAEQLMLMCSYKLFGVGSSSKAIAYSIDSLLAFLPDRPIWRDGSGLSRYNLFTPRSMISLLNALHQQIPEEKLFDILPTGGVSGTIRNWYGADQPYVFAKTGTLSNKHCLSGFIRTQSGRVLLFSFMNNNYINGSAEVKKEMQRILEWIRDEL